MYEHKPIENNGVAMMRQINEGLESMLAIAQTWDNLITNLTEKGETDKAAEYMFVRDAYIESYNMITGCDINHNDLKSETG